MWTRERVNIKISASRPTTNFAEHGVPSDPPVRSIFQLCGDHCTLNCNIRGNLATTTGVLFSTTPSLLISCCSIPSGTSGISNTLILPSPKHAAKIPIIFCLRSALGNFFANGHHCKSHATPLSWSIAYTIRGFTTFLFATLPLFCFSAPTAFGRFTGTAQIWIKLRALSGTS